MNKIPTSCQIIGGGITGLLTALELNQSGMEVTLFDRQNVGQESSWAGGGILSPLYPWRQPQAITSLSEWGQIQYPKLSERLTCETSIDPEWFPSGMIFLDYQSSSKNIQWLQDHNRVFEHRRDSDYPFLQSVNENDVLFVSDIANIRPPRLTRSLKAYLKNLGVKIIENEMIDTIVTGQGRVTEIHSQNSNVYPSDCLVIAAGAWSGELLHSVGMDCQVEPVKGEMITYQLEPGFLPHIIIENGFYLIPRKDGLILAGSTVDYAGFDKRTSPQSAKQLHQQACSLIPELKNRPLQHHWAGLRPGSPDGIPIICEHPSIEGLFVNTGHFRNGLTLAPASAKLMADLILKRQPITDPNPYKYTVK